jgi:hypothetical protein
MRFARLWAILSMSIIVLSACNTPTATPTEVPLPDARTLLSNAAKEVQNAKSVRIKLQLTGAPSYVDPPGNTIAFVSANGAYQAPDRVRASVVAQIMGLAGEVEVIAIGDDQWMKNKILTADQWVKRIFSPGFNAAKLISSDQGIQSALGALKEVKVVAKENIDGVEMYHIHGDATGSDIAALTVGLIRGSDVVVDIYVVIDTGRVDRVVMVQPDTITKEQTVPTTWMLEIFDYNAEMNIESPDKPAATAGATGEATATDAATSAATAESTSAATP